MCIQGNHSSSARDWEGRTVPPPRTQREIGVTIDGFVRKGLKTSQNCASIIHFIQTEIFSQCYNVLRIIMQ